MLKFIPALSPSEPDPALLARLDLVKRIWLILVALITIVTLAAWAIPPLGRVLPHDWRNMRSDSATAALLSALGLRFSEPRCSKRMRHMGLAFGCLVTLLATGKLAEYLFHISLHIDAPLPPYGALASAALHGLSLQAASAYAPLGLMLLLIPSHKRFAIYLGDLAVSCLGFVVLVLVSGYFFGVTQMFGIQLTVLTSVQTLTCLVLLTQVAFFRQAEAGAFSIFLGHGIAGRIARFLAPVVLILPFLREAVRARILGMSRMPAHYVTAMLASMAAAVSMALLIYLAWKINGMEMEIRGLTLRDALTDLYNLRGFRLLAEQAVLMAHRSDLPFSVLFIDLDNLKQTNDSLGHQTGSELLVATAEILRTTFRETDVLGRIGGDEFAVAGQFGSAAIALAALRLQEAAEQRNAADGPRTDLSFSVGHVTSEAGQRESLSKMLAEADQAMYDEKRRKKVARRSNRK
jgi:diguanylate cyclase (GGDEF)-like protein